MDQKQAQEVMVETSKLWETLEKNLKALVILHQQSKGRGMMGNVTLIEGLDLFRCLAGLINALDQNHTAIENSIYRSHIGASFLTDVLCDILIEKGIVKDMADLEEYSRKHAEKVKVLQESIQAAQKSAQEATQAVPPPPSDTAASAAPIEPPVAASAPEEPPGGWVRCDDDEPTPATPTEQVPEPMPEAPIIQFPGTEGKPN